MTDVLNLRLYPRGFLGRNTGENIQARTTLSLSHNGQIQRKENDLPFNAEVTDLYVKLIQNKASVLNFEFREAILKVALYSFGVDGFKTWAQLQQQSSMVNEYHSRFIDDIVLFVETGRHSLPLTAWATLIDPNAVTNAFSLSRQFNEKKISVMSGSLITFITNWCSQPNGVEDLIYTLHILFGKMR